MSGGMKHAYLITAYSNFKVLELLLKLLDEENNMVFLHIDKKVSVDVEQLIQQINYAKAQLCIVPRYDLTWGDVSEIKCIVDSMEYMLKFEWDYVHYITEGDMPLKTQAEIHRYFEENNGKEFIDFCPQHYAFANYKCQVYHGFIGSKKYRKNRFIRVLSHGLARLQMLAGIRRNEKDFYHGSGYFSITRSLAKYVVAQKQNLYKQYDKTLCGLEVFLQTLCYYSEYRDKVKYFEELYLGNLRYIDWKRRDGSSPYTFLMKDYEDLLDKAENTEICFARKFNQNIDMEVARKLYQYIQDKQDVGKEKI